MKVAIFTDTYLPQVNGVVSTLLKLIEFFNKNNIEYRIIAPKVNNELEDEKTIRMKSFKFILYPDFRITVPNYLLICRELDNFNPDIIHVITEYSLGLCGLRYAKSRSIPIVSSFETNVPQYMEYYHLSLLKNKSWVFYRWFHRKCNKTYCPSQATKKLLLDKGINNVAVWDRGIELERFSPKYRDNNLRKALRIEEKVVFLYVGRVSPEKNLKLFLQVANELNIKYRDKVHFIIVGDGPSLNEIKKEAPSNMMFTGFLKGVELSKIYASSDVFMFTSTTETLGLVLLEAMASGLAVIACNEGGASDNLTDGYNCIACGENKNEFYNAAEKMILNPLLREKLSKNAAKFKVTKKWEVSFNKLVDSYKEMLVD